MSDGMVGHIVQYVRNFMGEIPCVKQTNRLETYHIIALEETGGEKEKARDIFIM